jgi:hypothetical protein
MVAAIIFAFVALRYREVSYLQDETAAPAAQPEPIPMS